MAAGGHLGADPKLMEGIRANLDSVLARNPNIEVSGTVARPSRGMMYSGHPR